MVSPSHKVNISYQDKNSASIKLDAGERGGGNRDFILRYSLQGATVDSGLLLFEGEKENFFLLTVEPPKRPSPRDIPSREYLFVLDVSGSMYGFPLDTAKTLIKRLVSGLKPSDHFNVLLFAGDSKVLNDRPLPATAENVRNAVSFIEEQRGGGGTEILPALKRALGMPKSENCSRSIVVITDGYVNVEKETFDLIRKNLGRANLFAFGIGSSVNRYLIEGMARAGTGEHFIVTDTSDASRESERFRRYIDSPLLTNVKVDFGGFDVYAMDPPSVPDLFGERPIMIIGKWRGDAPKATIKITGTNGNGRYEKRIEPDMVRTSKKHAALKYLWARHRIATLGDYEMLGHSDERKQEITNLGLTYSLLTEFTSFVAVDREETPNPGGKSKRVKQPLPLPQGVSNYAVGGNVPSTPEPETWLMIALLIGIFSWFLLKNRAALAAMRR
jgi:Ca-activated chloride channel family protein